MSAETYWDSLREAIDDSEVENLALVIGDETGALFSHEKGDLTVDTHVPIASASKWMSAMLILKLVDEGAIALSDHPQDYLSWWTDEPTDPRSRITLEQLLSFTSGYIGDSGLGVTETVSCITDPDTTLDACVEEIYQSGHVDEGGYFQYEPGTHFVYGPTHLHIAGSMATQATSQRWNQLLRTHLKDPLGLQRQTIYATPSINNPRISGGAFASATDYGEILTALAGGRLLSPESVASMVRDHTPEGVTLASTPNITTDERAWHYGLGCWRECNAPEYTEVCDEPGVISSPGAFGFYPWWNMRTGIWGVLSAQIRVRGASITVPLGQRWAEIAHSAIEADRREKK